MALNTVTLTFDLTDMIQAGIPATLTIVPTAVLTDVTDGLVIPKVPRSVVTTSGVGQLAGIVANDNAAISPSGTGYVITVTQGAVTLLSETVQIFFANGATQTLASLTPAVVGTPVTTFMLQPSGTPSSGQVPVATGTGQASAWGAGADTTAADIQPLAVSAAAGSNGKWADSGHVHPNTGLLAARELGPADHGLIAWNFTPYAVRGSDSTPLPTAGLLFVSKIPVPYAVTVTNICYNVVTAGVTLTAGQCFAAIYTGAGVLLAATADQSANFAATGNHIVALTSSQPVAAGYVYAVFWFNGTTGPALARTGSSTVANIGLSVAASAFATANAGITTTAPGSLSAFTALTTGYWAGIS